MFTICQMSDVIVSVCSLREHTSYFEFCFNVHICLPFVIAFPFYFIVFHRSSLFFIVLHCFLSFFIVFHLWNFSFMKLMESQEKPDSLFLIILNFSKPTTQSQCSLQFTERDGEGLVLDNSMRFDVRGTSWYKQDCRFILIEGERKPMSLRFSTVGQQV